MKKIYQGAESIIWLDEEKNVIIKERIKKGYRLEELDEKIRKKRTEKEAKILEKVRRIGINVPKVLNVEDFKIEMEFINGKRLKEILNEQNFEFFAKELGKIVATLHSNNIVHNDLTTSNFIFCEGKIYLIDFGLSEISNKIEKFAEDLLVLYYALKSAHFNIFEKFWEKFLESYKENFEKANEVIKRLNEIFMRGRYVERKA